MEKQYDLTGWSRKDLCAIISTVVKLKAEYLGLPDFAYQIGEMRIDMHARVTGVTEEVHQVILDAGIPEIPIKAEAETGLTVSVPKLLDEDLGKLDNLLKAKGNLIQKALQADRVTFKAEGDQLHFLWFDTLPNPEVIEASQVLVEKLVDYVQVRKRVSAKPIETDNEKYTFRVFLLALGLVGPEYKAVRKTLLQNLPGDSALRKPRQTVEDLRTAYPKGCRVKLLKMQDDQAPPIGTLGIVEGVDDIGSLIVSWDNGSNLHVLADVDKVEKIEE